jgi:membrane fusion protein, multidrug efflux system
MRPVLIALMLMSQTTAAQQTSRPVLPEAVTINSPRQSILRSLMAALILAQPISASAQEHSNASDRVQEVPRPVVSEIVTADPTRQRAFPGVIGAEVEVALAFQTFGRVAALEVDPGDRVEAGQVLATLDQVTLEEDVAAARAALEAAQAEADLTQQSYSRTQSLFVRNVATEAQLEQAQAARDATAAQVESARAQLAQAEEVARFGALTSPQDGLVLSTEVQTGTLVSAGMPVLTIADPARREAQVDVPAEFARVLSRDAEFEVSLASGGVSSMPARLRLVEPVTDPNLRTRRLLLSLDNPPEDYRIGSLVTATYATDGAPLMTLPTSAIVEIASGAGVWRVEPDARTVELAPVELGPEVGNRVVITQGIEVGDEIVTRGAHSLAEGQVVRERVQ